MVCGVKNYWTMLYLCMLLFCTLLYTPDIETNNQTVKQSDSQIFGKNDWVYVDVYNTVPMTIFIYTSHEYIYY